MLLRAFAKINLNLRILGRRPDGYHEVRTILQTIDWYDEIRIEPAGDFHFVCHGSPAGIADGESNLVVRAVRAFERATGKTMPVHIELVKHIPAGAGLGGGSADAAVTLLGLQQLAGIALPAEQLQQCLRALGTDVPFFALGGRALGIGRGDELHSEEDRCDYWVVVVCAGVHISTVEAYSWLTAPAVSNTIKGFHSRIGPGTDWEPPGNDFESVVFARHPVLREIRDALLRAGAGRALLSGSGSAVFGCFERYDEASRAAVQLDGYGTVRVTRPLSKVEYWRSAFSG